MTSSVYISNFSKSVFNPDTDYVLSITPDELSITGYVPKKSKITYVTSCSYSTSSSYALSFTSPFNQDLNSGSSVTFNNVTTDNYISINNYKLPLTDGSPGQIMVTDGSGSLVWEDLTYYSRQFSTRSVSGQLTLLTQISIPNNQSLSCKFEVMGASGNKNFGLWNLNFCVKNLAMTSSIVGNIIDDNNVSYLPVTESACIYRQSYVANTLSGSYVYFSISQSNTLNISVSNPDEFIGIYGTDWKGTVDITDVSRLVS